MLVRRGVVVCCIGGNEVSSGRSLFYGRVRVTLGGGGVRGGVAVCFFPRLREDASSQGKASDVETRGQSTNSTDGRFTQAYIIHAAYA